MIREKLTGKTRHRVHKNLWGYYLILQVEVHREGYEFESVGGSIDSYDVDTKYWKDAKLEDLEVFNGN